MWKLKSAATIIETSKKRRGNIWDYWDELAISIKYSNQLKIKQIPFEKIRLAV
jgi:hypothetical protein